MLPAYADRQRGEKKRYFPLGVIGMSHNAPFNIVCMNFINIGRDGIIALLRRMCAAYQSKDHYQKPEAKNKSHGGIVDVRLCTDVERPWNGSRKP